MTLAPGTRLGPYEILAPLGAGGMGEVYRARDTRLQRDVAIKGLPDGFAGHPDRLERFEREARLLASLSHPNVGGIFGLEESVGTPWLVLELIDGETLAQRLARGPLSVRETLEVGARIAAGVDAAHERGIVHRDLKPGNVMLTSSQLVKVLDFGLAKGGASDASSPDLSASPTMALTATATGVILGTACYMSPEQARGKAVDRRADVWAFGCILFECLTGRQAFRGETVSDVIACILEREADWQALPPAVPARLRELIARCLTKSLADRPRDLGDLGRELNAITVELSSPSAGPARAATPSLAVLYFENLAHDADSEYFCSGITEDILTDLGKLKNLRVASRNAVARYRGGPVDLRKVAEELGVGAVLEGSVRRAGDRVRISAQLVDGANGFHLWAERYDRTLDDVFAVQEEIASAIAGALSVALTPREERALVRDRPADVQAYDLYLKGRARYNNFSEASLNEALALFRQATEIDPQYALAYAGIADCYGQMCQWLGDKADVPELTRKGLEAARHALRLNPKLAEAHKAEALNLRFTGDHEAEQAALRRAIEANPRYTPALINLAVSAWARADVAGAERLIRRVLDVDPQDAFGLLWLAELMLATGRREEALAATRRVRTLSDEPFYVTASRGTEAYLLMDMESLDAAQRVLQTAVDEGARLDDVHAIEGAIALREGRIDAARERIRGIAAASGLNLTSRVVGAATALGVGEPDLAVALLAGKTISDFSPLMIRLDPALHALLDRPAFAPRRSALSLVWPLEAPMMSAACHRLFREVRIESGQPDASEWPDSVSGSNA